MRRLLAIAAINCTVIFLLFGLTAAQDETPQIQQATLSFVPTATAGEVIGSNAHFSETGLALYPAETVSEAAYLSTPLTIPLQSADPFLSVGSLWTISTIITEHSTIRLSLRGSIDGQHWQQWTGLHHLHLLQDGRQYAHLVQFDPATRYVQFRIQWNPQQLSTPVEISNVQFSFISPGSTPQNSSFVMPETNAPSVVSRTAWGCPDGQGSRWNPQYTTVTHFIVHHTVTSNNSSNWAATVRAIWNYHAVTLGWGDIGYNFLIDPTGTIYEGRAGGDGSIGAHFSCANGNTMGVALLGTYTSVTPSGAMIDSLEQLLADKATTFNLDPLATTYHASSLLTIPTISGHRDGNRMTIGCPSGTVCPGNVAYSLLPSIRTGTDALIDNAVGVDVNGDGRVTPVDAIYVINRLSSGDLSADVNGDSQITMDDVIDIWNALGN